MTRLNLHNLSIEFSLERKKITRLHKLAENYMHVVLLILLTAISIISFYIFYKNGLGLAYNDARSHLDIGRRVVENLKPGFAQLGSVWLPLPHLLMVFTIWNDFMWHSGLAGALQSMISFVATGAIIYAFLKKIGVNMVGRLAGMFIFVTNLNILYMQSTAMTELLLLGTMTAGVYELVNWHSSEKTIDLIKAAFWIMLSTLIRYDGWFLFAVAIGLIFFHSFKKYGYKTAEGVTIFFCTLAGFGIVLWFLWNLLIFKDALYFAFGPYSAYAQQLQLQKAGVLATKHNLSLSLDTYYYALAYNAGLFTLILGTVGAILLWFDTRISTPVRIATLALLAPLAFNVVALYQGSSVIFVQGLGGNSWFNVRYGLMMVPSLAIFVGYLIGRIKSLQIVLISLLLFVSFFAFNSHDAVTIDDAVVGASGKNVTEVSGWLRNHASQNDGYILISVASHDAIIFSSGLPMSRFIHEGTGMYWNAATAHPSQWAEYIIMRTHDKSDNTFKALQYNQEFKNDYILVSHFPFADIYEIKPQFISQLQTKHIFADQK